jgi:hypothetical protein
MDFYAIYGIAPYTEPPVLPVFPVTDSPYVRTTVTTSTMYMTTTALLLTTILKTTVSPTVKSTPFVTTLPTTSSITTVVTTSQMTTFRNDQVKIENFIPRKFSVTTRKKIFPVTAQEGVHITKIPYNIPRIVTPRYSTLKEPQVIYSWTRTTSSGPIVSTRASTYRYFIKGVKTTWSKEKIMGIKLLSSTAKPIGSFIPAKKSKTWHFNGRGKYLKRTSSETLFSTSSEALTILNSSSGIFEMRNSNESISYEEKIEEIDSDILSIIAITMVGLLFVGLALHVVYRYVSCTKKLKIKIPSEKVVKKTERHPLRTKKPNSEKISIGEDLPLTAPEVKTTCNCARHSCHVALNMMYTMTSLFQPVARQRGQTSIVDENYVERNTSEQIVVEAGMYEVPL